MMTADELGTLCSQIRARNQTGGPPPGSPEVDGRLVDLIERDVAEYRKEHLTDPVPQLPPDALLEVLPRMGWLIYEASLDRLWVVPTQFDDSDEVRTAIALIRRLADVARGLVWPEFAPRALGAIRAQALVESKRDTEAGFDAAWILHNEAEERYRAYSDTHGSSPDRARYVLALDEVFLQLALAETGTACRTAERVIGRWVEEFRQDDAKADKHESERWTQRMFAQLVEGIDIGEQALVIARRIRVDPGFTDKVTDERMTLRTGLRNPSIMTCRAILLAYSLCPEMGRLGRNPPGMAATWAAYQKELLERFDTAFPGLLAPVVKVDGSPWPLNAEHRRSLVQLCLHLGLVKAAHDLPETIVVDDDLTLRVLDDPAVEAMSAWLAVVVDGRQRGDANIVGSSSKPDFNASVEACRKDPGAAADYKNWRIRWFELDRYAKEPGRRERIVAMFDDV